MTPREPDRFDKQAWELFRSLVMDEARAVPVIAAALRAAESSALERAARIARRYSHHAEREIRALIPPAAAPAAETPLVCGPNCPGYPAPAADYDPITAPIPGGDMNGPHGPLRTVPMMPVDEAADARMDALRAAQPPETSRPIAPAAETGKAQDSLCDCGAHVDDEAYEMPSGGHARAFHSRPAAPTPAQGAEARIAELETAIRWALGEEGEFRAREPGEGAFWWRIELRKRAGGWK